MSIREQSNRSALPVSPQAISPPTRAGRAFSEGIRSLASDTHLPPWFRITTADPRPPSLPGCPMIARSPPVATAPPNPSPSVGSMVFVILVAGPKVRASESKGNR